MPDIWRQASNVVAFIIVLVVNYLSNALPINGRTAGEISDQFPVYFVPAGYVFSIWGLIYLLLAGFVIYQALPSQRENPRLRAIGYLFVASCAANVGWLFAWHYGYYTLSMLAMLLLLAVLIVIYLRLRIGQEKPPGYENLLLHLPFSVYLGWITVATVANATTVLYAWGFTGWGLSFETWAVIMLLAAAAIGAAVSLTRRDVAYNLVLVWAFIGIYVEHQGVTPIGVGVFAAVAAVLAALIASLWLKRNSPEARLA